MNSTVKQIIRHITRCAGVGFATFFLSGSPTSAAPAPSEDHAQTAIFRRYSLVPDGTISLVYGHLLNSGRFVIVDVEEDWDAEVEGVTALQIKPISGRPVMLRTQFDSYMRSGLTPLWTRSLHEFPVGDDGYVIVGTVHQDPNPRPTFRVQPRSLKFLVGTTAYFQVGAEPREYLSYQWFFKKRPLEGKTTSLLLIPEVSITNVGTYSVTLNTGGMDYMSRRATLSLAYPVVIKRGPCDQTIRKGRNVVFRVTPQGTKPFTYQWYFNGQPIQDETNVTCVVRAVRYSDAGTYSVKVTNPWSQVMSTNATLTVVY